MRRSSSIGDKLGLYKAMAGAGPMTSAELAEENRDDRALRPRMAGGAGCRRIRHLRRGHRKLHAAARASLALADEKSPVFLPGFFQVVAACVKDEPKITDAFRTGKGVGWHEHDHVPVRRHRALLPPQLSRSSDRRMDSCAGRHRSEAQSRREASRTWAAAWALRRF